MDITLSLTNYDASIVILALRRYSLDHYKEAVSFLEEASKSSDRELKENMTADAHLATTRAEAASRIADRIPV